MLLLAFGAAASAATLVVTSTADTGAGSLRETVVSANPGDTITFDLPTPSSINLLSLLTIDKNLTLQGPGRDLLSISPEVRQHGILQVPTGVTAVIRGLSVQMGAAQAGGGLSNSGTTTLSDCSFKNNTTVINGGFNGNLGAAIYNEGNLTVTNCIFAYNEAYGVEVQVSGHGGAIYNGGTATAVIKSCTFVGNKAFAAGGAIENTGTLNVIDSSFLESNKANDGGAIYNGGTLVVDGSTFFRNKAVTRGGAIFQVTGSATMTNTTLVENTALAGGAIFNSAPMTIIGSTIASNTAPNGSAILHHDGLTVSRTLFLHNDCFYFDAITSAGDNLAFDAYNCVSASQALNDRMNLDPLLLPLSNNGGPTMTQMPAAGSPALDEVRVNACTGLDQRGVHRPQGVRCDIGAVEREDTLIFRNGFG
jgi:hypothetical protein